MRVDTVFGGCYKRNLFERAGLYNESLIRSQDMDFNIRIRKLGASMMLFPDISIFYYPKATLASFWKHNIQDGIWAIYPLKFVKVPLRLRHYVPLLFVLLVLALVIGSIFWRPAIFLLAGVAVLYVFASLFFSAKIAIKEANWSYLFIMPVAFAVRHFGYGIGSLYGVIKLAMPLKNGRKS